MCVYLTNIIFYHFKAMVKLIPAVADSDDEYCTTPADMPKKRRFSRIRHSGSESDSDVQFTPATTKKRRESINNKSSSSESEDNTKVRSVLKKTYRKSVASFFGNEGGVVSDEESLVSENSIVVPDELPDDASIMSDDSFVVDDDEEEEAYSRRIRRKKRKPSNKNHSSDTTSYSSSSSSESESSSTSSSSSSSSSGAGLSFHMRFIRGDTLQDKKGKVISFGVGAENNINREHAFRRFVEAIALSLLSPTLCIFNAPSDFLRKRKVSKTENDEEQESDDDDDKDDVIDVMNYYRPSWDRVINLSKTTINAFVESSLWSEEKLTIMKRFPNYTRTNLGSDFTCKSCFLCGRDSRVLITLTGIPIDSDSLWISGDVSDFLFTRRLKFLGRTDDHIKKLLSSDGFVLKCSNTQRRVFKEQAQLDTLILTSSDVNFIRKVIKPVGDATLDEEDEEELSESSSEVKNKLKNKSESNLMKKHLKNNINFENTDSKKKKKIELNEDESENSSSSLEIIEKKDHSLSSRVAPQRDIRAFFNRTPMLTHQKEFKNQTHLNVNDKKNSNNYSSVVNSSAVNKKNPSSIIHSTKKENKTISSEVRQAGKDSATISNSLNSQSSSILENSQINNSKANINIPSLQALRESGGLPNLSLVQKALQKEGRPSTWLDAATARAKLICRASSVSFHAGTTCGRKAAAYVRVRSAMLKIIEDVYQCLSRVDAETRYNDPLTAARHTKQHYIRWFNDWNDMLESAFKNEGAE